MIQTLKTALLFVLLIILVIVAVFTLFMAAAMIVNVLRYDRGKKNDDK